ncbi:MAG TPA: hypothetical protein VLS92_07025, partial [Acidimicrobiia bacterium]|nr:hypothetical protein [Acidimicrobiia bacterium]
MRRLGAILALTVLLAAACGDETVPFDTTQPDGATSTEASTSAAPSTSAGTTTTEGVTTTATAVTTTTAAPAPGPTAADTLAAFFAAAETLDADIRAAAVVFNDGFDADAGTLDPGVAAVVAALGAVPLGLLIPAGLSLDLETAVLAVFADLDGRISALAGGVRGVDYPDMDF